MSGELHRHPLRHSGPHHVPDGRPPEIVHEAPRTSRQPARGRPGPLELPDPLPLAMEHPRDDPPGPALEIPRLLPLGDEERPKLWGHIERAPLLVLGRARLQADRAGLEVHLGPLKPLHLTPDPPPRDVGEGDEGVEVVGQMPEHGLVLLTLEEALTDVALLEHRDVGPYEQASRLAGEAEGPAEGGQLAIDGGVTRPVTLTAGDVLSDGRCPEVDGSAKGEVLLKVRDAQLGPSKGTLAVDAVVGQHIVEELLEAHAGDVGNVRLAFLRLSFAPPQQPPGLRLLGRARALTDRLPVPIEFDPPYLPAPVEASHDQSLCSITVDPSTPR
jgi:hypothetical protein